MAAHGARKLASAVGYDFSRGHLGTAPHPFATSFSRNDARITTRWYDDFLSPSLFGTLHESGHALLLANPQLPWAGLFTWFEAPLVAPGLDADLVLFDPERVHATCTYEEPCSYPEGIAHGRGNTLYVSSLLDGALYRADRRTGEGEVITPGQPGRLVQRIDLGRHDDQRVLTIYEYLLALQPKNLSLLRDRSMAYFRLNRLSESFADLKRYLSLSEPSRLPDELLSIYETLRKRFDKPT